MGNVKETYVVGQLEDNDVFYLEVVLHEIYALDPRTIQGGRPSTSVYKKTPMD